MLENNNKAIIVNTVVLYGRLVITMICGLFSTRFALKAIGDVDFGLYSVVASIIIFIGWLNTSMLSTCNRFIASAIGHGSVNETNQSFNVSFVIHLSIALLTLLLFAPLGQVYIHHFVNYSGDIMLAIKVFWISVLASALTFIWVPFNAILMARERFIVFCSTEALFSVLKLMLCYGLLTYSGNKLIAYSVIMALSSAFPGVVYFLYCKICFKDYVRFRLVKGWTNYKPIVGFSVWTGYGALVQLGQTQSASLIVNAFFNTIMNTALSVSNYLKSAVMLLTDNLTKSISPQITKSYASGNISRCVGLMVMSSKLSFMASFIVATPFIVYTKFIVNLWLGHIPDYSVLFTRIIMLSIMVTSLNNGISEYVFATGKIKVYQFCVNTLLLVSVSVGFLVLKCGAAAYWLLYVYLIFDFLAVVVRQVVLHYSFGFDNSILWTGSYLPSLKLIVLSLPLLLLGSKIPPILGMICIAVYQCIGMYLVCLSKHERDYLREKISSLAIFR